MKLKVYESSVNYTAQVVRIKNLRQHNNADRLKVTTIQGNNIICGLDTQIDDLVIFFPVETQLGENFAVKNDLLRRKDENGKQVGGLFEPSHRRVRCVKLRGEKSEGFICPVNYLDKVGIDSSKIDEGAEFNEIDGVEICQKYIPRINQKTAGTAKIQKQGKRRNRVAYWHFHEDTSHFARNIHRFTPDTNVQITSKWHGSSWIVSNAFCTRPLKWYERLLTRLGIRIDNSYWDSIYSSRRVVKNQYDDEKINVYGYYKDDIWKDVSDLVTPFLNKGMVAFGEVVGYTKSGESIQKSYTYDCAPGTFKIIVYRMAQTLPDGKLLEMPTQYCQNWCRTNGFQFAPVYFTGKLSEFLPKTETQTLEEWQHVLLEKLMNSFNMEKDCEFHTKSKVPAEGLVIRVLDNINWEAYKLKSFRYKEFETKAIDKGDVGLEDVESMSLSGGEVEGDW